MRAALTAARYFQGFVQSKGVQKKGLGRRGKGGAHLQINDHVDSIAFVLAPQVGAEAIAADVEDEEACLLPPHPIPDAALSAPLQLCNASLLW